MAPDGRTKGRTDGHGQTYIPPPSARDNKKKGLDGTAQFHRHYYPVRERNSTRSYRFVSLLFTLLLSMISVNFSSLNAFLGLWSRTVLSHHHTVVPFYENEFIS